MRARAETSRLASSGAVVQSRAGGALFSLDGGLMASGFPESRDRP
jgi:hypothetical protein